MLLPIIELDMTQKNKVYQLQQAAFSGEDNVYTIRLKPVNGALDYDWTDKVATIVFSPVSAPSQTLDVTDGVVSMLVNSAWVAAGLNQLQLNIYGTDGELQEHAPIVEWYVRKSLPATDPAPERVDIIADLIAQTTAAVDSLDVALDMTTSVETLDPTLPATVNLDKSGDTWELQLGIPQGIQGIQGEPGIQGIQGVQGEPGADGLTPSVNEVEEVNGNISITLDDVPDGTTRSLTELADIRVGYDGATYATAGDAVRGQVEQLSSGVTDLMNRYEVTKDANLFDVSKASHGRYYGGTADFTESESYLITPMIPVGDAAYLVAGYSNSRVDFAMRFSGYIFFDDNGSLVFCSNTESYTSAVEIPEDAKYVRVWFYAVDGVDEAYVGVSDSSDTPAYSEYEGTWMPANVVQTHDDTKVDKNGTDQVTVYNAGFIEKTAHSAQLLDSSSFIQGKKLATTFGVATPDDFVTDGDAPYCTIMNTVDSSEKKTFAINTNSAQLTILGYKQSGDNFVRESFMAGSHISAVSDHYEFTVANNVKKVRMFISTTALANMTEPIKMTYADEWEGSSSEYNPTDSFALSDTIKVPSVEELRQTVESLIVESDVPFASSHFAGIGDSIMIGVGNSEGGFLGVLHELYPDTTVTNLGVGSTTIQRNDAVPMNASGLCIYDRIDNLPDADYVILEGGINDYFHHDTYNLDFGDYEQHIEDFPLGAAYANGVYSGVQYVGTDGVLDVTTFCGAFEASLVKIMTRYYDKKYGYVIPHKPYNTSAMNAYFDAAIEICEKYQFPYLDLRKCAGMPRIYSIAGKSDGTSPFTIDAVHPNHNGYLKRYIPPLVAWLKTL